MSLANIKKPSASWDEPYRLYYICSLARTGDPGEARYAIANVEKNENSTRVYNKSWRPKISKGILRKHQQRKMTVCSQEYKVYRRRREFFLPQCLRTIGRIVTQFLVVFTIPNRHPLSFMEFRERSGGLYTPVSAVGRQANFSPKDRDFAWLSTEVFGRRDSNYDN